MHVMMTKEQFEELKKKAGGSKSGMKLKEDDDVHGTIETDDFVIGYYYNSAEGRLYLGPVSKRKTLAAYVAGENIIGAYVMEVLSALPSSKEKKEGEADDSQEKKA